MITFADKSMLPQLVTLWQQSFGDSEEYIQMFLDWNFERIKTIVYVTEDKPVSVAYLLPIEYVQAHVGTEQAANASGKSCWYLYAAATLPEYRGGGCFGDILKFIENSIPEPVILVPGEESLIYYYEKRGLHVWLKERKMDVAAQAAGEENSLQKAAIENISVTEYIHMRNSICAEQTGSEQGFMRWDGHFIEYICHENEFCNGKRKLLNLGEGQFLVMYRIEEEQLKILELLPQTRIEECAKLLADYVRCRRAEVILQPTVMATGKLKAKKENGYFNLIMG